MEKKKSERIKEEIRVGKLILHYSFRKLIWRELEELARVSAGNPYRCSDSTVKPSALAVRLEKPFRIFICRYWHCDSRRFIEDWSPFPVWGREGVFPWHVWSVGGFQSWAHHYFQSSMSSRELNLHTLRRDPCFFRLQARRRE